MASVTIGNNVTSIGSYAFNFCTSLSSVTIPSSVTSIGDGAFYWCTNLTSVTIPNSVTNIGDSAFYQCTSLASVTIGNNVTSIGDSAFNSCTSLTNITVDPINSVYCSVNGVLFDKSQRTLIQYPVGKAGTSYTVPASVTSIGEATFDGCTNLTGVTIPASVTNIGSYAFMWCTSLTGVYFQGNAPSVTNETTVFFPDPTTVYYLPCATGWGTAFDGRPTALWTGYPNVTVTVTANPSQGGSATGTGTYPVCSNVQISASASNGWIFTGWGDGSTNAIRTIPVPATNITYTADFLQQTGSVQVTISPAGAVTAGAQWKVDGGAWQNSGVTMSGVTVGSHTLHFNTITGWTTPADQSLTISNGLTTTATGYVQQFGSVQVTISPASAVTAGAQWQVDGGAWENSGVTMPGLTVGSHMLHFNTMMGWTTPANQSVTVNNSSTTTVTCAYVQQIGSVQVTISPAGAVTAGAQWQVDGGAWQNSGATVSSLSNGSHTVYFNTVTGWDSPVNQVIRISTGLTTPVTGTYTPIPCIYSISAPGSTVWCGSGSWSFNLTTSNWCSWAAVGNAGWITITSGSSGTGNGTVSGTYAANSNTSTRTGYISVGGQTFAVTQAGLTTATISVQANPANAGTMSGGGKYNVGSSQQISATAINTWVFVGWDDGDTNATRTIIVPVSGRTYTAFFDWASPLDSVKFTETYQDKIACDANKNCGTYPTGAFTINAVLFTGAGLAATNLNKTTPVEISIGGWSYQGKTGTLGDDPQYKAKAIKANLPLMYQDRTGKTKSAGTAILGFGRTNVTLTITVTAGQDAQHNTVQHMIDADQLTGNAFLGNTVVSNKISATFTIGDYLEFFTNIVVTGTVTAKNSQAKDGIHQVDTVKIKGASHR